MSNTIELINGQAYIKKGDKLFRVNGGGSALPEVTEADEGKFLRVVNKEYALVSMTIYNGEVR